MYRPGYRDRGGSRYRRQSAQPEDSHEENVKLPAHRPGLAGCTPVKIKGWPPYCAIETDIRGILICFSICKYLLYGHGLAEHPVNPYLIRYDYGNEYQSHDSHYGKRQKT